MILLVFGEGYADAFAAGCSGNLSATYPMLVLHHRFHLFSVLDAKVRFGVHQLQFVSKH